MFRSVGARLVTGVVLGALWLSAVVAPAAAVTHTRWVDNDNKPGDGPRACNHANFSSIQAAINASSAWDKVYVCPGNYQEQLTIDVRGLEVRSVPARSASIWAPETLTEVDFTTSLVHITARDVTFASFRLKFDDGGVNPTGQPVPTCSQVDAAIWAQAAHASILNNGMKTVGDNTLSGDCGYLFGIVLADPAPPVSGGEWGADTSLVWRNRVTDFKFGGILVAGERSARLLYNNIRYVHYNDPATCELVPVLGVNPSLDYPCGLPANAQNTSPLNGAIPYNVGIAVEGSLVALRANSVYSTLDTQLLGPQLTFLGAGIVLAAAADGSRVRNNRVDNVFFGIVISDDPGFIPAPAGINLPSAPDGVAVSGNRVSEAYFGFFVAASDGYYYANRAHLNLGGMFVVGGAGNVFDHNDFRYNAEIDCDDNTLGGGTLGTANSWDDPNLGLTDQPDGICMPFFPIN